MTMELGPTIRAVKDPLAQQRTVWGGAGPSVELSWPLMQVN
jgi:hypothetical protein